MLEILTRLDGSTYCTVHSDHINHLHHMLGVMGWRVVAIDKLTMLSSGRLIVDVVRA